MRLALKVGLFLFAAMLATRAAADDPKALVEKAIKAHGGEAWVKQAKAPISWKVSGKVFPPGQEIAYTGKGWRHLPNRMRQDLELDLQGQEFKITFASGPKGTWMMINEMVMDAPEPQQAASKNENHAATVGQFVALRDADYKLEALGVSEVDGKKVDGLKVTCKDQPDVKLFFDAATGLLAKCEYKTLDGQSGNEINQEMFFSEYKDFDGVKRYTKVTIKRDGEKFLESEYSDYKVLDKLDEKQFDKPDSATK